MTKRFSKTQEEKLNLLVRYLIEDEIGKDGLILADNDTFLLNFIATISNDCIGVNLWGKEPGRTIKKREIISFSNGWMITKLFAAAKRGDEDFRAFIKQ